jgi:hypothetical protein
MNSSNCRPVDPAKRLTSGTFFVQQVGDAVDATAIPFKSFRRCFGMVTKTLWADGGVIGVEDIIWASMLALMAAHKEPHGYNPTDACHASPSEVAAWLESLTSESD